MKNDKNNRRRKPKKSEEAEDLLAMIRANQDEDNMQSRAITDPKKLRDFLNGLKAEGTIDQDVSDLPGYTLGHEDGWQEGYEQAYSELFPILKAIETVIDPHVNPR